MKYVNNTFLNKMKCLQEDKMLENITNLFLEDYPNRCRILGKDNLNLFLNHQKKKVKAYKFNYYEDFEGYSVMAFFLGTYFDRDTMYPWAQEILATNDCFGVKVNKLEQEFSNLNNSILGDNFNYYLSALEKINELNPKEIENFDNQSIVDVLKYIYPEKFKTIGEAFLIDELKSQQKELEDYQINNQLGAFTYLIIKFMFGSYAVKDPLYAWVGKYMNEKHYSQEEKSLALFNKGLSRVRVEIKKINEMKEEA